ncbi:MAG: peptidoglycan-binding protein [Caulobacteraceae bacterium]|nr:peptidoglycan-binding protein [Caulobacteraceae bacterium]
MKGIDPKAREIAKDLARRSGMTLGEWLNQVILEDNMVPEEVIPPVYGSDRYVSDRHSSDRHASDRQFSDRRGSSGDERFRRIETPRHMGDDVLRVSEALDHLSARIEAAEHRSTLAISGIDQSVSGLVNRLGAAEREQTIVAARFEGAVDDLRTEQNRVGERVRRFEQEAVGPRSAEALRALEGALAKVAGHVYDGEDQTRQVMDGLRGELDALTSKVENGLAGTAVGELVDTVVARIAERLEQAEARTTAALRSLETSFATLDDRLQSAEQRLEGGVSEAGLEQLAASLSARVDAARAEMAEKIRDTADGRFDHMDRTLQEMTGHVQAAERHSAQAIERMGHEVLRMADVLGRRVQEVETRSADAIQQVGGEVSRLADTMETRFARSDAAGAQALEKLGGEIARITDRLAERIADAERRSAQAIDDVGEQLTRASDRMHDRHERSSSELGERIRLSEERTARLLEDARARIDQRLAETNRRLDEAKPVHTYVEPAYGPSNYADPDVAPFGHDSFTASQPTVRASAPETHSPPQVFAPAAAPVTAYEPAFVEPAAEPDLIRPDLTKPAFVPQAFAPQSFAAEPFVAHTPPAEPFLPAIEDDFDDAEPFASPIFVAPAFVGQAPEGETTTPAAGLADPFANTATETLKTEEAPTEAALAVVAADEQESDADLFEPAPVSAGFTPSASTKDLIEQARAASRAASQAEGRGRNRLRGRKSADSDPTGPMGGDLAAATAGQGKPKRQQGSMLANALLMSGAAAAMGVTVAGYVILSEKPSGALPRRVADALGMKAADKPPVTSAPILAEALNPKPIAGAPAATDPATAPQASPSTPSADAIALYGDGARRIESHDFTGVEALKKSANLGYAPAQFYLAKLYEEGGAGQKKDSAEARRWTERAAESGDRKAMHNLALYYFEGTGGAKNTTTAAQWFRRAADMGLVDSQYNLGRLYEEGFGVAQNPAEAYKWYLIAMRQGDTESRNSAQRIKGQLSAEAQAAAERAAQSFRPQTTAAPAQLVAQASVTGSPIATAQRALSHLGYYQGPSDGAPSPALKLAIAAYQRDQGLPATGALDQALNDRLSVIAQ